MLITDSCRQSGYLCIEFLLREAVEVHARVRKNQAVVVVFQTDIVQTDVAYGHQAAEWSLFLPGGIPPKGFYQESVVIGTVGQAVGFGYHVREADMRERYLVPAQRERAEMGVSLAYICEGVSLLVLHQHIAQPQPRGEAVFDGAHLRMCTERARQLRRHQSDGCGLYAVGHQHGRDHPYDEQETDRQHCQYVQKPFHCMRRMIAG